MGEEKTIKSRFRSKSEHSLDSKGRLNFPSRFRDVLAQYGSETLMVTTWGKHLRAYPVSEWESIEDKLLDQGKEQPRLASFIRLVLSGVTECNLDKQGRILLSASLRSETRIGKDIVLTGMRDWVEIWDKEAWQAEVQATRDNFDSFDEGLSKLGII
ncbi:MAG: division/cell wall cluster transcriptional repressor MraZ [Proteobacteria bacterium]|nr:division/cell wall cluster transcriptional repressor MraZ [Pseudomonadota bacterium]MBU1060298.1 division/cell wall cluster transcriptional repressor MraZ [Pseudomonadota bacterium]